ncbi:MAG: TonB-dependent receptor [Proteobacteria bacterium]|nr:TonB-dependent receptor [Pseudomonadota bacterium]
MPPTAQPVTLETVAVTGTHIRGVDTETEHPLVVLDRADLLRTGLTGVADIVQSLIIANGQTLNRNVNNSVRTSGTGELRVNLRSLGSNRTLVLVDGQRFVSAVDGAVDLSAIPLALVERIEVLKDGASAIYGSDAIGGVINIITRRKFIGADLGMYTGQTDHGDGLNRHVDFSFGRAGEKWYASFGLEFGKEAPIMAGARTISSVPAYGLPLDATGSSSSQYGLFFLPSPGQGPQRMVLIPGRPGTSANDFKPYSNATDNTYNFAPYNYLQTPQQRRAGFGQFYWTLSPVLAFHADALFNQRISAQQVAPPVIIFSPIAYAGTADAFGVSAQSIYNPFGMPVVRVQTRWPDWMPRRFEQKVDTTRLHLGFDGLIDAFGRNWAWNADVTQTRAAQSEFSGPYADDAKLMLAVGPSFRDASGAAHCGTPDNVIAGCVPLDLFTGPSRFTQAMIDYVDADVNSHKRARSDALEFTTSATLAELPGGDLGFASGLQRRIERGSVEPDLLIASGRANGTGVTYGPTHGAYSVNEAFFEFDVPVLRDRLLANALDVNLATRWSDYSLFGSTDNSRIGLRWKPAEDVLVRSTWAEGLRAPSIFESFGGTENGPGDVNDLCEIQDGYTPPPAVAANCLAHGVPADAFTGGSTVVGSGSNPALRPETSRSLTAGMVFSPHWLDGLDISADWYRIKIRNAIGNPGAQYFIDTCYRDNDPAACAHIERGDDGSIVHVQAINENLPGGIQTEGWDFAVSWKQATRAGNFSLRWENAYVDYWGEIGKPARGAALPDGTLAQGNVAGTNNDVYGVIWRMRSVASLAWQRGEWNASIAARYFSPIQEDCSNVIHIADVVGDPSLYARCSGPGRTEDDATNRVGAVTYIDLEGGLALPWQGRFTLGVRNAFDRNPPHAWSYSQANSFFPDYDIPGRFFYASYRQRF